jgi:hypothetical protein
MSCPTLCGKINETIDTLGNPAGHDLDMITCTPRRGGGGPPPPAPTCPKPPEPDSETPIPHMPFPTGRKSQGQYDSSMLSLALIVIVWAFLRRKQQGLRQWQSTIPLIAAGLLLVLALGSCGWWRRQRWWRSGAKPWHPRRYLHAHGDGHRGLWSFSLEPQRDSHFDRDLAETSRRAEEDCCSGQLRAWAQGQKKRAPK